MAVGLPLKTTYANGDVYSASDVNDTNGTVNLFQTSLTRAAGKNIIINGGFDIWQRGTSKAGNNVGGASYWADRWNMYRASNPTSYTLSQQTSGGTAGITNYARIQRTAADTTTATMSIGQTPEILNIIGLAGQAITVSFYARAGANYSPTSSALAYVLNTGTGTTSVDGIYNSLTSQATVINTSATLTTSWQRFTSTVTLGSTITQLSLQFNSTPVGTAGAADYYDITGVQIELGSYATTFSRAGGTIQGELANCQRYFWQIATGSGTTFALASAEGSNTPLTVIQAPVTMRIAPTLVQTTGSAYYVIRSNSGINTFSSFTTDNNSVNGITVYTTGATITAGYAGRFITNNASSSLGLSAEL